MDVVSGIHNIYNDFSGKTNQQTNQKTSKCPYELLNHSCSTINFSVIDKLIYTLFAEFLHYIALHSELPCFVLICEKH